MADELKCGTIFEKVAQALLQAHGHHAERNVWYRKRLFSPDWHQIDLEYYQWSLSLAEMRLTKHIIGECKYTRVGRIYLYKSIDQLLENKAFVRADEGILITNEKMNGRKEEFSSKFGIHIYDWFVLQQLYQGAGYRLGPTWEGLMKKIRYNPKKDHKKVERYIPLF